MSSKGISTAATATIGATVGAVTGAVTVAGAVTVLYGRWLWHIIIW